MARLTRDVQTGQTFTGRSRYVAIQRLWAFSGGPFSAEGWPRKNLHTDLSVAKAVGLPALAASGTQFQGYLIDLLIDLFGEEWLTYGTMDVRFVKIVRNDDTIIPKVTVMAVEPQKDGMQVFMDVWCENQNGEKVLVGTATGRL